MISPCHRVVRAGLALASLVALGTIAWAEDPPDDDNVRAADALARAKREAAAYRFHLEGDGTSFVLEPEAVLKWSNPVFGSVFGDHFLWTANGHPAVIGGFVKWYHPHHHSTAEFHSLSSAPIVGERDGQTSWAPGRPGVEWAILPDAPAPAATPAKRLQQMRGLVKDFSARHVDEKGVDRDLRLLTHPVYRYQGTEDEAVDGALFTFTIGTDPEAFLLLESRPVGGRPRWHYALCRMTAVAVRASHRNKEVWSVPALDNATAYGHRETYTKYPVWDAPQ